MIAIELEIVKKQESSSKTLSISNAEQSPKNDHRCGGGVENAPAIGVRVVFIPTGGALGWGVETSLALVATEAKARALVAQDEAITALTDNHFNHPIGLRGRAVGHICWCRSVRN